MLDPMPRQDLKLPPTPREAELIAQVRELRAVLQGIIDLGGTMGSALYAETVDRAARRALSESKEPSGEA